MKFLPSSSTIFNILLMLWPATATLNISTEVETTTTIASVETVNDTATSQLPTAAKLVRFRRQPPVTIIKHIVRSSKRTKPRRRIKRPKVRYGPPSYSYEEHLPHSKSHYGSAIASEAPLFSFDELQNYNLDATEFEFPPSSYEAQSMDLDFYSHNKGKEYSNNNPSVKISADEYRSFEYEPEIQSGYSYKSSLPRKPHQKYGIPKNLEYSTEFKSSSDYYSPKDYLNTFHKQSSSAYGPSSGGSSSGTDDNHYYSFNTESESQPTSFAHIPSNQYSIPSTDTQQSHSFSSHTKQITPPVSTSDSYTIYEKRLPNTGYSQNFESHDFEPAPSPSLPKQAPTQSISDIKITYSPSYEINLLPSSKGKPDLHSQPGNFAEPPENPSPNPTLEHFVPTVHDFPSSSSDDYLPPSHELPINPHPKQPTFDYPKSSYEVPIYDPIPFDASNNDEQEFYPPNNYAPPAGPVDITHHIVDNEATNDQFDQHQPDGTAPQPIKDLPKDTHGSESDVSATSTTKFHRNRKHQRHPAMKHILDVPELKNAFEAAKKGNRGTTDADVNASTNVEKKQTFLATPANDANIDNYYSPTWNPMRVRTVPPTATITSLNPIHSQLKTTQQDKSKPHFKFKHRTSTTVPSIISSTVATQQNASKIAIISVEKSRSQSYYDGTLAPPILTMSNVYNSRLNKFKTPTRHPLLKQSVSMESTTQIPNKDETTSKHSTKSIFDTTHFKAPQNDEPHDKRQHHDDELNVFAQNLPRNHKLY